MLCVGPMCQDWCDGAARLAGEPGDADRKRILYDTCKALEFLHLRTIVHRGFGPRTVMWFPSCVAWKIVALGALCLWHRPVCTAEQAAV